MEQLWTEFSGVAGRVLRKSISGSSLVTGIVLGLFLILGDWVLIMMRSPGLTMPFNQIVLALALARFALNGLFGEWNGTVFSGAGGPWSQVALVTARYLALTALWLVPTFFLTPSFDQTAMMAPGMGPQLSGGMITAMLVYMLAMTLTPPLFLIVSVSAEKFSDVFKPSHWGSQISGRMGDLFSIYVGYTGTLGMIVVLAVAPLALALNINMQFGLFVGALVFCLIFGMSVNLLGRLCGFFVCGELGAQEPAEPAAHAPRSPAAPATRGGDDFDPTPAPLSASAPAATPIAVVAPIPLTDVPLEATQPVITAAEPMAAPAVTGPAHAPASPAAATGDTGSKKPPLMDSKERVEIALKRFDEDPAGALSALRDMNENYAPHPHVMEALTVCLHRSGDVEAAVAMANRALPLCFERGHSYPAARIYREMRPQVPRLGLDSEKIVQIAAALNKMGDLSGAAKAYSSVIETDSGNVRAVKGLLQVADRIATETTNAEAAVKVYRYLVDRCPDSPLMEYMRQGLAAAERKLGGRTPAGVS